MIPTWLKNNPIYPRARVAALSLVSVPHFYNPVSAVFLCPDEREQQRFEQSLIGQIRMIRQEDGLRIWNTPLGELATADTETEEHVSFLAAEFGRDVYFSGKVHVKPGTIVLDVGANIGLFSLQASRAGAGQIVAVEPTPGNVRAFRHNLAAAIEAKRVSIVTKGAWNVRDTLSFTVDPQHPARNSVMDQAPQENAYKVSIDVAPLDLMVQELQLPRIDFIKMDIEGAEVKALQGAAEILRRDKPQLAIAVEHTEDWLANAKSVRELVLNINPEYRCTAGPYVITKKLRLAPEVLYFS